MEAWCGWRFRISIRSGRCRSQSRSQSRQSRNPSHRRHLLRMTVITWACLHGGTRARMPQARSRVCRGRTSTRTMVSAALSAWWRWSLAAGETATSVTHASRRSASTARSRRRAPSLPTTGSARTLRTTAMPTGTRHARAAATRTRIATRALTRVRSAAAAAVATQRWSSIWR